MAEGKEVNNTDFFEHYEQLKKDLAVEMQEWENLQLELEEFDNN